MEQQFHRAQKMEAIGILVGGIAHDFNNILAGMTGNLYLANMFTKGMPDVQQKLANVEDLSFRAADLIKQLLTFARKDRVSIQPLPLTPFIKEAIKLFHSLLPENIIIHQEICRDSILINGDAAQLHQVLLNLVTNARDALEHVDEPSLTIKLEAVHVDNSYIKSHEYFKNGHYAHLSIHDNGSGISEDHLNHLFEPFFTTKEQGKGTGLGLAMAYGAIKTHHGYIEVDSTEGKGSTFHIYIPMLKDGVVARSDLQDEIAVEGQGELILLVDDEVAVLHAGKEVLESFGYQVLVASDGLEAVDVFTANRDEVSLIIIDVVMPKLGGVKAVERMQSMCPDVKVIFSTGYDKETILQGRLPAHGAVILSKPYDIDGLKKQVSNLLHS